MAAKVTREESPPGPRQSARELRQEEACKGRWMLTRCKAPLTRQQATWAISWKSFTGGDVQKGHVCELDVPSKKPHHSVPAGCMIFTEERKVQPQPCTKDNRVNDLKADNILAFQMSLLIFPPFRTAKSLHGCF